MVAGAGAADAGAGELLLLMLDSPVRSEETAASSASRPPKPPVLSMPVLAVSAASACVLDAMAVANGGKWHLFELPRENLACENLRRPGRRAGKTVEQGKLFHQSSFEEEGTKTRGRITSRGPRSAPNTNSPVLRRLGIW